MVGGFWDKAQPGIDEAHEGTEDDQVEGEKQGDGQQPAVAAAQADQAITSALPVRSAGKPGLGRVAGRPGPGHTAGRPGLDRIAGRPGLGRAAGGRHTVTGLHAPSGFGLFAGPHRPIGLGACRG